MAIGTNAVVLPVEALDWADPDDAPAEVAEVDANVAWGAGVALGVVVPEVAVVTVCDALCEAIVCCDVLPAEDGLEAGAGAEVTAFAPEPDTALAPAFAADGRVLVVTPVGAPPPTPDATFGVATIVAPPRGPEREPY
ncbi:MAG: hypothetical protein JO060_09790 [Candidatus Eremiobacteraeota bacterium]|nr:hypothetical protein [Candidatus Eremiobacteraeota bacterium]